MGTFGQPPACPIAQLIAEYEGGMTGHELAKKYNVSPQAIYSRLHNAGIVPHKHWSRNGRNTPRIALPVAELIARYEAGESTYALAAAYNVRQQLVWQRLRAAGCRLRPHNHPKVSSEALRADYEAGRTAAECAAMYGMAPMNVYQRWWRMGLKRYNKGGTNGNG